MPKEIKTQDDNTIYALHYKGRLMGNFKWSQFGPEGLYGWRPPKKVYFKLGLARSGACHIPEEILDDVEIVEYKPVTVIEKLSTQKRQEKRIKKEIAKIKENLVYYKQNQSSYLAQVEKDYLKRVEKLETDLKKLNE